MTDMIGRQVHSLGSIWVLLDCQSDWCMEVWVRRRD